MNKVTTTNYHAVQNLLAATHSRMSNKIASGSCERSVYQHPCGCQEVLGFSHIERDAVGYSACSYCEHGHRAQINGSYFAVLCSRHSAILRQDGVDYFENLK